MAYYEAFLEAALLLLGMPSVLQAASAREFVSQREPDRMGPLYVRCLF